jgi:hypothetical protein
MKSPSRPTNLSYYTTWWLPPASSMSSPNAALSGFDENLLIENDTKKQVNIREICLKRNDLLGSFFFVHLENNEKSIEINMLYSEQTISIKLKTKDDP